MWASCHDRPDLPHVGMLHYPWPGNLMVESGVDIGVQLHFIFGACQESMDQRAGMLLVYNFFSCFDSGGSWKPRVAYGTSFLGWL